MAHPQIRPAVSACCGRCPFLDPCDGIRDFSQLFNCVQNHCCGGKKSCPFVCPNNDDFTKAVGEIHGLRFQNLPNVVQQHADVPLYVPHLNHQYSRDFPLDGPVVSVTPYSLFRARKKVYTPVADTPGELRRYYHLHPNTRVILRGTEKDKPLEKYWEHGREAAAPDQLAKLGVDLVTPRSEQERTDVEAGLQS